MGWEAVVFDGPDKCPYKDTHQYLEVEELECLRCIYCGALAEETLKGERAEMKTRVVIESPLRGSDGDYEANRNYSRRCIRDSLKRGEAPFWSGIYDHPYILDDRIPLERMLGMQAGFAWGAVAELCAVYVDLGISDGMQEGIDRAKVNGIPIRRRRLSDGSDVEWTD